MQLYVFSFSFKFALQHQRIWCQLRLRDGTINGANSSNLTGPVDSHDSHLYPHYQHVPYPSYTQHQACTLCQRPTACHGNELQFVKHYHLRRRNRDEGEKYLFDKDNNKNKIVGNKKNSTNDNDYILSSTGHAVNTLKNSINTMHTPRSRPSAHRSISMNNVRDGKIRTFDITGNSAGHIGDNMESESALNNGQTVSRSTSGEGSHKPTETAEAATTVVFWDRPKTFQVTVNAEDEDGKGKGETETKIYQCFVFACNFGHAGTKRLTKSKRQSQNQNYKNVFLSSSTSAKFDTAVNAVDANGFNINNEAIDVYHFERGSYKCMVYPKVSGNYSAESSGHVESAQTAKKIKIKCDSKNQLDSAVTEIVQFTFEIKTDWILSIDCQSTRFKQVAFLNVNSPKHPRFRSQKMPASGGLAIESTNTKTGNSSEPVEHTNYDNYNSSNSNNRTSKSNKGDSIYSTVVRMLCQLARRKNANPGNGSLGKDNVDWVVMADDIGDRYQCHKGK